jgi:hypothetical protein
MQLRDARAAALAAALLLPTAAAAGSPQLCARYARQIAHYENMRELAEERGNAMWEERLAGQVESLRTRAQQDCPDLFTDDDTAEAMAALLKVAARAALTYFTFGAF